MAKALKKPRKKATGYKMPDPLPQGEILTDISKTQWRLGTSIGKGGFGEIYAAQEASTKSSKYPYVIKVEPHGNGPLFVEMHFYMKNAKQADIDAFMSKHKLKTFGMPVYIGSGSHEIGNTKYRFIVMEKFGSDIDKLRMENKGALPASVVFQLAWQMTYVLEYIHEFGYIHADIKGANILMGTTPATKNQAYLVDFGLATKFTTDKEFKPNPKKAHDGTIEYLSRDAHQGVPTRRGDLEILGYNLFLWLGGELPWFSHLEDPKTVQQIKEDSMSDIPKFVKTCLGHNNETIAKFLQYISNLKFNEEPNYKKIRTLFEQEVKRNGATVLGPLEFNSARKRRSVTHVEEKTDDDDDDSVEVKKPVRKREKKQKENGVKRNGAVSPIESNKARRRSITVENKTDDDDSSVEIKKPARKKEKKQKEREEDKAEEVVVMTEAMKEVLARKKEKDAEKKKKTQTKKNKDNGAVSNGFEGYTAEMIEVKMKKIDNEKKMKARSPLPPGEESGGARPRRHVPVMNYDERTPKPQKKKH